MTVRRSTRVVVDGVLLLDKPAGITSSAAVQKTRNLFNAAKAGHTGTLDPQATGLLPICLGEATKFAHLLLDADKTYRARVRLGVSTETGDSEGRVTASADGRRTRAEIEAALGRFRGPVQQTPPMYSAVKHEGQRLYRLARAGTEVEREPRSIVIHRLELTAVEGEEITLSVTCSKGTYIRVLAEDIGKALGCGASLAALRREAVGSMTLTDAVTLERLEGLPPEGRLALLQPPDILVAALPRLDLDAASASQILRGQGVEHRGAEQPGLARIYGPDRSFLGVVEVAGPGRIQPKRLKATQILESRD